MNAAASCLLMKHASAGNPFRRDNADFMNNFWVNIVARSFTNIEEQWQQAVENKKAIHQKEVLEELGKLKPVWKEEIEQECMKNFNTFENKSTEASQKNRKYANGGFGRGDSNPQVVSTALKKHFLAKGVTKERDDIEGLLTNQNS